MLFSRMLIPTLKETPAEAEAISHKLLLRARMIRKVASGIYNYLPLGRKVLAKVERIVREEMDRAGAQEVLMPAVQPAELWQESGRWGVYGKELLRFMDRRTGLLLRPHPRRGDHRPGAPGCASYRHCRQSLPGPDEVPG